MAKLPGEKLRDSVAELLGAKFRNVVVEKRLKATTADIFFLDDTYSIFPRPIAVECKDWNTRISSEDLARIHTLYQPSLAEREIDYLWIIGRSPLSGSPRETLSRLANVRYSTFEEFRASLMNFSNLLQHNILSFEHSDAAALFVPTRIRSSDETLSGRVEEWLRSDKSGLIVFGGYGVGKTTFSLHLASALSSKYMKGEFDRIPIRIQLGGMYSKQDVVALVCSALSGAEGGVTVRDFSFSMFQEMNRQGQYLLIFDGFDEMRHAMDLEDFVYTFEQMKPLFAGRAKVILLGRPDSFLSNQEEDKVLDSLFDVTAEKRRKLERVDVAFFNKDEVLSYLDNFMRSRGFDLSAEQKKNYKILLQRISNSEDDNILLRPVQLKMFTSIIDECLASDELPSRYNLYQKFIYNFIVRESRKSARQPPVGVLNRKDLHEDRKVFMQALAWWVLTTKRENKFLADEIPLEIIPSGLRAARSSAAAVREALVGSVIEPVNLAGVLGSKASSRYYYFPHKSYLEFLVADYFEGEKFGRDEYRAFLLNVNEEILSFIEEGPSGAVSNLRRCLMHGVSVVDARIFEVCATDECVASEVLDPKRANRHSSEIYTHYFYLKRQQVSTEAYLRARLVDSVTLVSALAVYNCVANEIAETGSAALTLAILAGSITGLSSHKIRDFINNRADVEVFHANVEGLRAAILARCLKIRSGGKNWVFSVDALSLLVETASYSALSVRFSGPRRRHGSINLSVDSVLRSLGSDTAPLVGELIKVCAGSPILLPIKLYSEAADRFG